MATGDPTVFVVDDDAGLREALAILLRSVGWCAETFASPREFLDGFDPDRPGCLVLDVRMPGMDGLQLQQLLKQRGSDLPVIVLSAHGDVPMVVRAMKAGAVDFLQKPLRHQELLDRVAEAIEQNARLREARDSGQELLARLDSLTVREREVMDRIAEGGSPRTIAADLGLSQKTVENHRSRLLQKMGADSVPHLLRMLYRGSTGRD